MLTPLYGGRRHVVLLLSALALASHQLPRDPRFKFFGGVLVFPRSLSFDFCYDLDIWGQGQALIAFFVVAVFFTISLKYEEDFDQTGQEAS